MKAAYEYRSTNPKEQKIYNDLEQLKKRDLGNDPEASFLLATYHKIRAKNHSREAILLARINKDFKSPEKSSEKYLHYLKKAANSGHAKAQSELAFLYFTGEFLEKSIETAIEYWKKAAAQEYETAQFQLAMLCLSGVITESSDAPRLYLERSAPKLPLSKYFLGEYYDSIGDYTQAITHYNEVEKCEDQNAVRLSKYALAKHYFYGAGIDKDINKAKEYAEQSQELGFDCKILLNDIYSELNKQPTSFTMTQYSEHIINKNLSPKDFYTQIESDLKNDFNEGWNLLENDTKTFLISGIFAYINFIKSGEKVYQRLDFSSSVVPMFKALENELYKYFFVGYINYLKIKNISPEYKPKEITWIPDGGKKKYHSDPKKQRDKFTLGSVGYILGVRCLLGIDNDFIDYFDSICNQNSDRESLKGYLESFAQKCSQLADYRNGAAHHKKISHSTAANRGNDLIKGEKLICNFIKRINIEKAAEYINY